MQLRSAKNPPYFLAVILDTVYNKPYSNRTVKGVLKNDEE